MDQRKSVLAWGIIDRVGYLDSTTYPFKKDADYNCDKSEGESVIRVKVSRIPKTSK